MRDTAGDTARSQPFNPERSFPRSLLRPRASRSPNFSPNLPWAPSPSRAGRGTLPDAILLFASTRSLIAPEKAGRSPARVNLRGRKVRAPQGRVLANGQGGRLHGSVPQKANRRSRGR